MDKLHIKIIKLEYSEGVSSKAAYYKLRDSFGFADKTHSCYRWWKYTRGIISKKFFKCKSCSEVFEREGKGIQTNCKTCINSSKKRSSIIKYKANRYPVYGVWSGMLSRCTDPRSSSYKNYGGRGISICKEWMDYYSFGEWCIKNGYSKSLQIDRIDNNGNYSSDNCIFVKPWINTANRRSLINTSGFIGVRKSNNSSTFRSSLNKNTKVINLGSFKSITSAAIARDLYIIENNLPHTLNFKYE